MPSKKKKRANLHFSKAFGSPWLTSAGSNSPLPTRIIDGSLWLWGQDLEGGAPPFPHWPTIIAYWWCKSVTFVLQGIFSIHFLQYSFLCDTESPSVSLSHTLLSADASSQEIRGTQGHTEGH